MRFAELFRKVGIWFVIVILGAVVVVAVGAQIWGAILHGIGEKSQGTMIWILLLGFSSSMGALFAAFRWKDRL